MKLVRLLISNFRSIGGREDSPGVSVDLDDINVIFLVGKNNVGKSSVLKAYEKFVLSISPAEECDFHKRQENPIVIEGWFKGENEEDYEHAAMKKSMCPATKIAKFKKVWTEKGKNSTKYTYDFNENEWRKGGAGGFDTLLQNACPEPIWLKGLDSADIILENIQKLIREKVVSRATELPRYKNVEEELELLKTEVLNDEYVKKVQTKLSDLIQETFDELSVTLFTTEKKDFSKELSNFISTDINISSSDEYSVHMTNHGHGIRRQFLFNTLRGLSDIFNELNKTKAQRNDKVLENIDISPAISKKTKMLLIEEPELFLHPQAVRMFADILYSLADESEFQIMAATHSPVIVDLSRDHTTILRTRMNDQGETKVNQVKYSIFDDDEKERMKMLNSFNPYVCEAFFADYVILVEGDTEAIIYREIIRRMIDSQKIDIKKSPLVVNCGSKMNIPSFQKVLRHFDINYFVIHDLDDTYNKDGKVNAA